MRRDSILRTIVSCQNQVALDVERTTAKHEHSPRAPRPSRPGHSEAGVYSPGWRLSLRTKLLVAVNAVLLIGLAALLVWDFQRGLAERLHNKHVAMAEEAALVLSAIESIRHQELNAVQAYLDKACIQMQDAASPGHHIAAQVEDLLLQARSHHRASPDFALAMRQASTMPDYQANVGGHAIIVGSQRTDGLVVYVSEFTRNIREAARAQMRSRAGAIALVGLALTGIVNLVLVRLVTQPIRRMVETVQRIGAGELGIEPRRSTTTELDDLATEIGAMSRSLAKADQHRAFQMAKARRIQRHLMPSPDQLYSVGIHHTHLPADDVGGDFFDVQVIDDDRLAIYLGDVSGHGVPASMSASMLKILIDVDGDPLQPSQALQKINRRFQTVTFDGHFATMFMCMIDRRECRLAYASAGHETAYLIRRSGRLEELNSTGMLLGVDPNASYELTRLKVTPGDTIVLLTDGVVETMSPNGDLLGRDAVAKALAECGNESPRNIADQLLRLADRYRAGEPQLDDITVAVLRV